MLTISMVAFSSVHAQDEINRWEFFGGYSYMNLNRGFDPDEFDNSFSDFPSNRVNAHGFNGSITYNFRRFIGAKFDLTLHSHGEDFNSNFITVNPPLVTPGTFKTSQNVYQFMGGIQIKDNKSGSRFKPFAHAMIGAGHGITKIGSVDCPGFADCSSVVDNSETGFAGAFGGGLDIRINNHLDFRAIQVDYNPIGFNSGTQNNVRFGIGLVFK